MKNFKKGEIMKLELITLNEYLTKPVYRSINITRVNGDKLLLAKTDKGIVLVDTKNGYDYSRYTI